MEFQAYLPDNLQQEYKYYHKVDKIRKQQIEAGLR